MSAETSEETVARLKREAVFWPRGNRLEDFSEGRTFEHPMARTLGEADNTLFTTLTLHYNPIYTNAEAARAAGHPTTPINPLLVFNTVFGLSVEDLSEGGGPFLGVNGLTYGVPVYPGDTLAARSVVKAARRSQKRAGFGIVTWATTGTNQRGETVVAYERSNLVRTR